MKVNDVHTQICDQFVNKRDCRNECLAQEMSGVSEVKVDTRYITYQSYVISGLNSSKHVPLTYNFVPIHLESRSEWTSQPLQQVNNRSRLRSMKRMKVPALPALCSDITDEMVESENAVICLPPALCSGITDRGSGGCSPRAAGRPRHTSCRCRRMPL